MAQALPEVQWRAEALPLPGVLFGNAARTPYQLALRHCSVEGREPAALARVVIAPALGVPQRYYAAFAQWLAQQGFAVTTWDYHGHGESLQGPLRAVQTSLLDWAEDCAAVAQHVRGQDTAQGVQRPLLWVGHSVGAQLPGMSAVPLPIDGLLAIASGSGYWRDNAAPTQRKVWLFWGLIAPLLTALCGYLPGKRWGMVGDLPAGVLWQWRRWCLHPEYAIGVEGDALRARYAAARYPVHALHMHDDEMMSPRSIAALLSWYGGGQHVFETVQGTQAAGARIGHLGFFRKAFAPTLWPLAARQLQAWVHALAPAGQGRGGDGATVDGSTTSCAPTRASHQIAPGQRNLFSEAI